MESRITSCRSTTRCIAASQSCWCEQAPDFDECADVVRHIGRRYWRRLPQLPLGKCQWLKIDLSALEPALQPRSSVLGHAMYQVRTSDGASLISGSAPKPLRPSSNRSISSLESASTSTSSAGAGIGGHGLLWGRSANRRGTHVPGDQCHDLSDGARAHQARRWETHTDGAFDRVFDFCAHQGIQPEIRERLVIAQALRFHTQHGSHDIANRLR